MVELGVVVPEGKGAWLTDASRISTAQMLEACYEKAGPSRLQEIGIDMNGGATPYFGYPRRLKEE